MKNLLKNLIKAIKCLKKYRDQLGKKDLTYADQVMKELQNHIVSLSRHLTFMLEFDQHATDLNLYEKSEVAAKNIVKATKLYRERTGVGLTEAHKAVQQYVKDRD